MEAFGNIFGGYSSWLYACILLGTLIVGTGLRIWKVYFIPIPMFGLLMMYFYLNNEVNTIQPSVTNDITLGFASIIPILAVVIGLFVVLDPTSVNRVFGCKVKEKDK
jgi:hypothetical protein